ncbi:MAG: pyridoxamine 5'-phosphate oxidase family protein [Dehalococcoidia bacterium]
MDAIRWGDFGALNPELAAHILERLASAPCYFGTVRRDGWPRVHPVGPLAPRGSCLIVTMYPTSPKAHDLRRNGRFALHGPVEDTTGGGGEVLLVGRAVEAEPADADRAKGYILFELLIGEVLATSHDHNSLRPVHRRWKAADS